MGFILLIVLVLLLVGAMPNWASFIYAGRVARSEDRRFTREKVPSKPAKIRLEN